MHRMILTVVLLFQMLPSRVLAQGTSTNDRIEVFGSLGRGGLSRLDDSTPFGSGLSIGGGIDFRLFDRLGVRLDVHGMRGLEESVKSAVVFSTNVVYDLTTSRRAQPYVLGGVGMLRTDSRTSTHLAQQSVADSTDVGWGINLGGGVRAFITPRLSLRPEVTYINGLWNSTENLSDARASVAVGYHW